MNVFCIGESSFCALFSYLGIPSQICMKAEDAVSVITSRLTTAGIPGGNEMILVSETLLSKKNKALESLLNDPAQIIVSIPSPIPPDVSADLRSMMRRLLGES